MYEVTLACAHVNVQCLDRKKTRNFIKKLRILIHNHTLIFKFQWHFSLSLLSLTHAESQNIEWNLSQTIHQNPSTFLHWKQLIIANNNRQIKQLYNYIMPPIEFSLRKSIQSSWRRFVATKNDDNSMIPRIWIQIKWWVASSTRRLHAMRNARSEPDVTPPPFIFLLLFRGRKIQIERGSLSRYLILLRNKHFVFINVRRFI